MKTQWKLFVSDGSDTTLFAKEEFIRLIKIMDREAEVTVTDTESSECLSIGLSEKHPAPTVEDGELDDGISVEVENCRGYITGANERSVLFGVYRFFTEAGASFVRPGRDGEMIPSADSSKIKVKVFEKPAYRYRGVCFEGSCGFEHIVELIDFAPKLFMNIAFTQLHRPDFALDRWYEKDNSPSYVPTALSESFKGAMVEEYDREILKRGLKHHRMGHGWIPSVIGEKTGLWHAPSKAGLLKEKDRHLIAEINGERRLYNDSAVDTSFCYGNPEARRLIVNEVVSYAKSYPERDTLHVWLADQPDNQCECALCRDTLPSDFYVDILNELDLELTREGLDTKIIFLSYLELMWAPKRSVIKNPDRFALLFAPIRRPYERPLSAQREGEPAPFRRNAWTNPCTTYSSLKLLDGWLENFHGDCLLFDYHLMWDFYNDVTGLESGRLLGVDMAELNSLGLSGMISCQGVRIAALGALPMKLMANALWRGKSEYEKERDEFFAATYGVRWKECKRLLEKILKALPPNMLRGIEKADRSRKALLDEAKEEISSYLSTPREETQSFFHRVSFLYFDELLRFTKKIIEFMLYAIDSDSDGALPAWKNVLRAANEFESLYPRAFDAFEFSLVWHRHVIPVLFPNWKIDYGAGQLTM